jgi:hypothetical protein
LVIGRPAALSVPAGFPRFFHGARVTFGAFHDRLWYFAVVSGGVSVVAMVIAWRSWQRFRDALKAPLSRYNGDVPYQREWDFRYWRRVGRVTAVLSIFFSILWLIP